MVHKSSRLSCADRLNYISAWWFWITIIGVFYFGIGTVLPCVYQGYSDWFFSFHHSLCYFMFTQMVMNWACVKFVNSSFRPGNHTNVSDPEGEIAAGGYEINLNHLKSNPETGAYSIPAKCVSNGSNSKQVKSGTLYLVAVPTPEEEACGLGGDSPTTARSLVYPYWSWKPCFVCQCQRPPRTHHCPLCNVCILKRDHHCFFTGSCIGLQNQRHFIVFNFWASIATSYCMLHSLAYLYIDFVVRNSFWDLLLPLTIPRWLLGYTGRVELLMICLLYSVAWFWLTSVGFFAEQIKCIVNGTTSFEEDNNIKVLNMSTLEGNIRGVFGQYWYLNFFLPLHWKFPSADDGIEWRGVKV